MEQINLRPHHGLCIEFFEGKGYSDEFTVHMAGLIDSLTDDTLIHLISGEDAVCSKCPNNLGTACRTPDKVNRYDAGVLTLTGLTSGSTLTYAEFRRAVREKILDAGNFSSVCGDCQWADICHKGKN